MKRALLPPMPMQGSAGDTLLARVTIASEVIVAWRF